jgi:hypothetical protein
MHDDKGKEKVTELRDEKDPKRARVVLSKGHEVVELGYSRLSSAAAEAMHKGENLGNLNRVSNTEQRYRSRVNQTDRVSQICWTTDRINEQIGLAKLLIWKDELWRTRLEREAGLRKARGAGNQKKEKVLPQVGGQLRGGA